MAVSASGNVLMAASPAVVRALLDALAAKDYQRGVLGIHAAASWDGPEKFTHRGRTVQVAACPSTLAVWEALRVRENTEWLVILTPREPDDLGGGVLAHLAGNRLRTPDPWQAVQQRFEAKRLDPQLYAAGSSSREVATGLLTALPADGWPPAPGGVLTRDHALGYTARTQLGVVEPGEEVDVTAVLSWSARPESTGLLAELRNSAGDALVDAVIDWLAQRCGLAAGPVRSLLLAGRVADIVPLGILSGLLSSAEQGSGRATGQFEGTYRLGRLSTEVLTAWYNEAAGLTAYSLPPEHARRVLDSAARHVHELGMDELARSSELLPAGLRARLADLADQVRAVLPSGSVDPRALDQPLVTADLSAAEQALTRVQEHHLGPADDTARAFQAAMRLVRWLAGPAEADPARHGALGALVERQVAEDSWVDAAVNPVARGAEDSAPAEVLGQVLGLVRTRRDAHDLAFGAALAAAPEPEPLTVEQVLPQVVVPLARQRPVLLLVLDGLSVAVAIHLVRDAGRLGWVEHALPGRDRRVGALAVLPTLTEFSRCSLLCGELRHGQDDAERQGFAVLLRHPGLDRRTGGDPDVPLFHKTRLDTSRPGQALDTQVRTAIADTDHLPLVGAVLNAVDDALHHTDPGGIDWRLDTVRHLKPLLDAAWRAGRAVVLTSDHGHVIERRNGELRQHTTTYGARARAVTDTAPAAPDEVVVRGPRVLTATGDAVLAVTERVRYGPLNAGYHGGGSPAEVVVPVVLLYPGDAPHEAGSTSVDGAEPAWWHPAPRSSRRAAAPPAPAPRAPEPEGLFELTSTEPAAAPGVDDQPTKLAKAVLSSRTFKQQRAIAGRIPVADDRITALLAALLAAPDRRVPAREAAAALGVGASRLRGALSVLKRVLDVEGYVVLSYEAESGDVLLDEATLCDQFGVRR